MHSGSGMNDYLKIIEYRLALGVGEIEGTTEHNPCSLVAPRAAAIGQNCLSTNNLKTNASLAPVTNTFGRVI